MGIERVAHLRLKKVAYAAIRDASRIRRSYRRGDLGQQSRRDERAVVCASPRQMRASVGGVVHAEHDLAGEHPLDSQIPHVNVGVSRRRRAQIVRVLITPVRKLAVLRTLRTGKAPRKRIRQGRGLGGEIVVRKKQVRRLAERRAGILEVCSRAHSEIDARPATHHRLLIELVRETQPRPKVFPVGRNRPHARCGELRCAEHLHATTANFNPTRLHCAWVLNGTRRRRCRRLVQRRIFTPLSAVKLLNSIWLPRDV